MRAQTRCIQCGQTDDHPKFHYGDKTYHHDCLPADVKEEVAAGVHSIDADMTARIIQECEDGLRGDEFLARIQELHEEVYING